MRDKRWFRIRRYPHFDRRACSLSLAEGYVQNAECVRRHSFWPFISYEKTTPRYCREERRVKPKCRPIAYAAHLDSHIYSWYAHRLSESLERVLRQKAYNPCVLAYRTLGKSNIDFAKEAFDRIEHLAPCVVMAFDISGFFDNLSHDHLKQAWCSVLDMIRLPEDHYNVFRSITRYSTVDRKSVYEEFEITPEKVRNGVDRICSAREFRKRVRGKGLVITNPKPCGIPQGSPISAVLSNIYLLDFDRRMCELQNKTGGVYRRYSDDILWICPPGKAEALKQVVYREIQKFHLEINPEKTETSSFERDPTGRIVATKPIQYLGFTFDGQRISIRSKTLARYYRRMKTAVRSAKRSAERNANDQRVYRRRLYERFSHLGSQNFVTYGKRATRTMNSETIRRQMARHWDNLHRFLQHSDP